MGATDAIFTVLSKLQLVDESLRASAKARKKADYDIFIKIIDFVFKQLKVGIMY